MVIEIEEAYEEEILPRVLSLGEHAEILSPKSCREKMVKTAKILLLAEPQLIDWVQILK